MLHELCTFQVRPDPVQPSPQSRPVAGMPFVQVSFPTIRRVIVLDSDQLSAGNSPCHGAVHRFPLGSGLSRNGGNLQAFSLVRCRQGDEAETELRRNGCFQQRQRRAPCRSPSQDILTGAGRAPLDVCQLFGNISIPRSPQNQIETFAGIKIFFFQTCRKMNATILSEVASETFPRRICRFSST